MGKKISKRSQLPKKARKSISEITIQEGNNFVASYSRRQSSRLIGTRTMKQIVRSHIPTKRMQNKKVQKDQESPSKLNVRKNKMIKKQRKQNKIKSKPIASSSAKVPTTVSAPILASAVIPPVVRTGSRASNIGKAAQLSKSKSKDLQIPAFGFIDVCFCVDSTGSMSSQLAQVQEVIKAIIQNIQNKVKTQGLQLRFAIVSYRDHPPQDTSYVTKHLDFTDQFEAIQYVKQLQAFGGGDQPEAAHDGLLISAKNLRWVEENGTPVLRYIFHIADAPPHGKQFKNIESQQGCLCGLQTDEVIRQINKKSIHYRLIKARANNKLDQMQRIFKSKVGDFDSTDIKNARELNVKVSDMIIHEVLPDYA